MAYERAVGRRKSFKKTCDVGDDFTQSLILCFSVKKGRSWSYFFERCQQHLFIKIKNYNNKKNYS